MPPLSHNLRRAADADVLAREIKRREDRELKIELAIVDVHGRERVITATWAPFGPSTEDPTLVLTTGLTGPDLQGVGASLRITDPLGRPPRLEWDR